MKLEEVETRKEQAYPAWTQHESSLVSEVASDSGCSGPLFAILNNADILHLG